MLSKIVIDLVQVLKSSETSTRILSYWNNFYILYYTPMTSLISSEEAIVKIVRWEEFKKYPSEGYTKFVSIKKDWEEFELYFKP